MIESGSIRELADAIKGSTAKADTGSTVGATVIRTAPIWVRVDGSETSTPIASSTVAVAVGDRVSVRIEGGTATVTGNVSNVSTGAVETARAVEPVAIVAQSAFEASELAQANAERAKESAQTAHSAAQDAVKSASDAGRAAAVAQAAMGSTTVDWHDYTVQVGEDGQWHAFDKNGAEVPLSEISMVYQDALGLHILGESTRMDIDDDGMEIVNAATDGGTLASFGVDGMRVYGSGGSSFEISHIGYGQETSGYSFNGPYYTFGSRLSSSEIGAYSFAEGQAASASGTCSHAEGLWTTASGQNSHSEGLDSKARGYCSHAGGIASIAEKDCAFAHGNHVEANYFDQAAFGKYNANAETSAFEIGNGTSSTNRSNAFAVDWDGNVTASGTVNAAAYNIGGTPLLVTDTCTSSQSSISGAGTLQATIPTHDGYTPIAIAGFNQSANTLAVLRAYINGSTAVLAVRNMASSATSGTATFTILYAANGVL